MNLRVLIFVSDPPSPEAQVVNRADTDTDTDSSMQKKTQRSSCSTVVLKGGVQVCSDIKREVTV